MTNNQIQLRKVKEDERAHRADEAIRTNTLSETVRHNYADENIRSGTLSENIRHNYATENIEGGKLAESIRHNYATENISAYEAQTHAYEAQTHAKAQEETARHNAVEESYYGMRYAPQGFNYLEYFDNKNTHVGKIVDSVRNFLPTNAFEHYLKYGKVNKVHGGSGSVFKEHGGSGSGF